MDNPAAQARRQAFAAASPVTEAMIHNLVHAFYAKVRRDPAIGPIFNRVIAEDDWPPHLAKMCDFWSSVTLMTGRFKGSPMQAHIQAGGIRPTHFARWLHLFQQTAEEVCPPDAAAIFVERSQMIARSLQMGLHLASGDFDAAIAD
ncbi:MAG TPA: group III truncated hemoglobin [Phenylobacterium sp.]|uniref:group III truncated hemoglobin n=1 Tax=Phenylobacterium sp. TaxID=1871053 RepID=UPI002BEDBF98|nr:group III truncated hemoglobin [Phenylobacterium sp.]HSV03237.1 group III truncated hemoglobin [Phenylobacterium sp.]